jgi:deazaflavin-dependent oxidoreductase (nitroreductase family)
MDVMSVADRSWPVIRRLTDAHTWLYRATRGVFGHRFPGAPPILLLEHAGARSGVVRTTPLAYVADGPDVVIVASKGGHPRNPAWLHNLQAHPDTTVQIGSQRRRVHARVASEPERKRLWPMAVKAYAGYGGYQERADREIPLVVLQPRD